MDCFLQDAPRQIRRLRALVDASDASGVRFQAHTLQGAAATVGAEALRAVAAATETAAAKGALDSCRDVADRALAELDRLKEVLRKEAWPRRAKRSECERGDQCLK
jgi:HPt (histidine-containing phosphotransfer) domain-containing protein